MHASVRERSDISVDPAAWIAAADDLVRGVAADGCDPSAELVERALAVGEADLVTLVVQTPGGAEVTVAAAAGVEAHRWLDVTVPAEGTLAGTVFDGGRAELVTGVVPAPEDNVRPISDISTVLLVPLCGAQDVRAVLTIGRRAGKRPFTDVDLALAALFARQVGQALDHRDAQARRERVVLADERDRIALALQADVIAPLFALGMRLQGAAGRASGAPARHLESGSDEIDETLKSIRTAIYRLGK